MKRLVLFSLIVFFGLMSYIQISMTYNWRLWLYFSLYCFCCFAYHRHYPYKQSRRFKLRLNGGYHTQAQWFALLAQYGYKCARCKRYGHLTKDHIKPISKGGKDNISNIQPLCRSCNSSKGTKEERY